RDSQITPGCRHAGLRRPEVSLRIVLQHCPDLVVLSVAAFSDDVDLPVARPHRPESGAEPEGQAGPGRPTVGRRVVLLDRRGSLGLQANAADDLDLPVAGRSGRVV